MKTFRSIKKEEIRDLLGKGWLTHDGSWFFETARELGIGLVILGLLGYYGYIG